MKQLLLICAVVGCGKKTSKPEAKANPPSTSPAQEVNNNQPKSETKNPEPPKTEPKVEVKKPLTEEESAKIIEKAIREELKKPTGELTEADLEHMTSLSFYDNQLTELPKGLEKLTQLKELRLDYNKLTDVKGLEKLTQLTWLNLGKNKLTSVKGLEKLTQLTKLGLGRNRLTDVEGLEKLTHLGELSLTYNPTLTKAQIAGLQKALPKCNIYSNPTK